MFTSKYADSSRHVTSMSWNCDNDDNDYEQDAYGDPVATHSVSLMNPEMKQNWSSEYRSSKIQPLLMSSVWMVEPFKIVDTMVAL